jgi:chromosomal replication initiator protein
VQGPSNRLAHAAAVAVAQKPGRTYNPLFLHGGVGLGKTHLLQAICLTIREAQPGASIYYTSCDGFITQFMDAVQAGQMGDFRHRFRDLDVLVIDDIHFLAKRERTQEEFFHTFNSLYQMNKQIVLSSDAAPEEIPDLEDRLVSRFKSGLVAKMEAPDYESRVAIVKTKGKLRGINLTPEVAEFIAARVDTNIRELEGTIVTLHMRSAVEGRPLSIELDLEALADRGEAEHTDLSIQMILDAVAAFYRVRPAELMSKRRHRSVAIPRQVCMFLARKHTRHSLEEVGLTFGGRDHTTVMHAVRMIETRLTQDDDLGGVIRSIEDKLRLSKSS